MLAESTRPYKTILQIAASLALVIMLAQTASPANAQGTGRPPSPTNLVVWKGEYGGQEQIRAYWQRGSRSGAANITHYRMNYGPANDIDAYTIETGGTGNSLVFGDRPGDHIPVLETQYVYRVRAINSNAPSNIQESTNAAGAVKTFKNKATPPTPSGVTATADSTTAVSVEWNHQNSWGVDQYEVCLDESSSRPDRCHSKASPTGGNHSATFTGLDDDTTYYVWVSAYNREANPNERWSAWSSRTSVTTQRIHDDTPPAVSGIRVVSKTHDTINFQWDALTQIWVDEYQWNVRTADEDPTSGNTVTGTTTSRTGLQPDTTYYVNLRAVNKYVNKDGDDRTKYGPWSRISTTTDGAPATYPPGDVTNFKVRAESYTTIRLDWDAAFNATGYEVEITADGDTSTETLTANTTSWDDTTLDDGETRSYRVRPLNSNATETADRTGNWTSRKSATTPVRPPPVESVGAYSRGHDSILFRWKQAAHATLGYEVAYSKNADFSDSSSRTFDRDADQEVPVNEHLFTGLDPETTYYFKVRSRVEDSEFSQVKMATTQTRPPAKPTYQGELRVVAGTDGNGVAHYDQLAIRCRDSRAAGVTPTPVGWVLKYDEPVYNYKSEIAVPEGETRQRTGYKSIERLIQCGADKDSNHRTAARLYHLMQNEQVTATLQACSKLPCIHYLDSNGDPVTDDADFNAELADNLGPVVRASGRTRSQPGPMARPTLTATHNTITVNWRDDPNAGEFRVFWRLAGGGSINRVNVKDAVDGTAVTSITLPVACGSTPACTKSTGGVVEPETSYDVWVRGYIRGHSRILWGDKSPIATITTRPEPD